MYFFAYAVDEEYGLSNVVDMDANEVQLIKEYADNRANILIVPSS